MAKVKELREKYKLSQRQFSLTTGIGIATVHRWENGEEVPNRALERYLTLLEDDFNMEKIRKHNLKKVLR